MKFFQVLNFYPSYLETFYTANHSVANAGFEEQISALVADGFGACHTFAPHMQTCGYLPFIAIANNYRAQLCWLAENNLPLENSQEWMQEIVRKQVDQFKPEVFYAADPVTFDSRFIRSLRHKPKVIIGFIGAQIPAGTDWTSYDVILSNSSRILDLARDAGARKVQWFWPGLPSFIVSDLLHEPKEYDLVFPGSWSSGHSYRNSLLQAIASAALREKDFEPKFFLSSSEILPDEIARFNSSPLWGKEMYRALRKGKIVFNGDLDFAGNEAGNMRCFETTAVGSFLLTQYHPNIAMYFEPGSEIETYRNADELVDKTKYYLAHADQRDAIAKRGQQRCFRDHIMDRRIDELDSIIRSVLGEQDKLHYRQPLVEDLYDKAYRWGWADERLRSIVSLCYKTPDFIDNAHRFYNSEEFKEALAVIWKLGFPPALTTSVLDIGCGNGVGSYSLARSGYAVTGIDSSLGELAGIRAAEKLQGTDGVHFKIRHAVTHRLDFPDACFDIVWMREVLHHIDDLVSFLQEVERILKPGGILCCLRDVVIWNEEQRNHFFANHPFYHITHDEGCFYLHEYLEAFEAAGLTKERVVNPVESVLNTYPTMPLPDAVYDQAASEVRKGGYDLFSFFLRKPVAREKTTSAAMERFQALQNQKEALLHSGLTSAGGLEKPSSLANLQGPQLDADDLHKSFPGVSFGAMVQILGMRNIIIGEGTCIGDCSWLNVCSRDEQIRMKIGNTVLVGRQGVLSTGGMLEIGDYCVLAPRVYISDADHIYADIMQPVIQQGATLNRSVIIEENCWLGINTVISGHLVIGRGSVIGANTVVIRDIPPFSVVVGNPAQIVKMYNPSSGVWERTRTEEDIQRILEERYKVTVPSRANYKQILRQNAYTSRLDPILSGRGNII